jgi:hypothetical protein
MAITLVTTARSDWHSRLSSAHPWVCDKRASEGEVYIIDEEKKEITFPGKTEPRKMFSLIVVDYPSPNEGCCYLAFINEGGNFLTYSISFMRRQ